MPLAPYTGTFGKPELLHLLRRSLFGVKKSDITYFSGQTLSQVVTALLTPSATMPAPPVNDYNIPTYTDPNIPWGTTWVNGPREPNILVDRSHSLRAWWIGVMVNQDRTIVEKMVMCWHNHVPTDIEATVEEPIYSYRYNVLLRQQALGNFKTMMRQMSIEPAMLFYLDGYLNTKTAPNDNYGRELQELFTIGKDANPTYTEGDVQAAAAVLTGWTLDNPNLMAKFDVAKHVTTDKTFSSFYNNTVITGRSDANAGLTELDELINMIFAKDEVAKYVVRKIYRFFVSPTIDATVEANVIVPLANTFRSGNYDIKPVMQELLMSAHFFDKTTVVGALIKNPLDYIVGLARLFGVATTTNFDFPALNKLWLFFHNNANFQQMRPGNPPTVSGWAAYYQAPSYHDLWINADTLRRKKEFSDRLISSNYFNITFDIFGFTASLNQPTNPNAIITEVLELMHIIPDDALILLQLKNILLSNQVNDEYWTNTWNNYVNNPTDATYKNTVFLRLKPFYLIIVSMAEFQLC